MSRSHCPSARHGVFAKTRGGMPWNTHPRKSSSPEASEHRLARSIGPVRDLLIDYGTVQVKPKDKRHAEGGEKRCR
jgi:hypothetical protein